VPNPGSSTVNSDNPVTINGTAYAPGNPLNFAAPVADGGLGLSSSMAGWYGSAAIGMKLGASAGDQSTGGIISFGPTTSASTNRALGLLATSTTGGTAFGVAFLNETTNRINQMTLSFIGGNFASATLGQDSFLSYYIDPHRNQCLLHQRACGAASVECQFSDRRIRGRTMGTQPSQPDFLEHFQSGYCQLGPGGAVAGLADDQTTAGTSRGLAIDNLRFSASFQPTFRPSSSRSLKARRSTAAIIPNSRSWLPVPFPYYQW